MSSGIVKRLKIGQSAAKKHHTHKEYINKKKKGVERMRIVIVSRKHFVPLECCDVRDGYLINPYGDIKKSSSCKLSKLQNRNGYLRVHLKTNSGYKLFSVHRLVLITFGDPDDRDESLQVNHIDGNKSNNFYKNLEWLCNRDNVIHGIKMGLKTFDSITGENHYCNIVSEQTIHDICKCLESGDTSYRKICSDVGVEYSKAMRSRIHHIRSGRCWKSVKKDYNIPKPATLKIFSDDIISSICVSLQDKTKVEYIVTGVMNQYNIDCRLKGKLCQLIRDLKMRKTYNEISKNYVW